MKHLIIFLFLCLPLFTFGQQNEQMVVNIKDLPPDLVQTIKSKQQIEQQTQNLEQYSTWAGKGKEIGIAFREGLTAVKDVSVDFSRTELGMFTMVMIAWKVAGKDIIRIIIGALFLTVSTFYIIRRHGQMCLTRKICIEDPGFLKYPKKYQIEEPILNRDSSWSFVVVWVILGALSALIMFA